MSVPTFIVGTGRCGSTLLSNLICRHPKIASLSEFFSLASDMGGRFKEIFPKEPISGPDFWALFGEVYGRTDLMIKHDVAMPEIIYPWTQEGVRFTAETGVPLISQTTLPHLTEDFDALYDEVAAFTKALPTAPVGEQYTALFEWLQARFEADVWIERSGGIFNVMQDVHETFPEARYIHIVRDGRNTALSMNGHRGFRLFVLGQFLADSLKVDPYYDDNRDKLRRVPKRYRVYLPETFDAQAFDAHRFPLSMMGNLWSGQVKMGLKTLDLVPAERLLTIRYEDLLEDPRVQLTRLTDFLGADFGDAAWLEDCASVVRSPRSAWEKLSDEEQATLLRACRPGFEALAERGVNYEV